MALRSAEETADLRRRHAHHRSALMSLSVSGLGWSTTIKNANANLSNGNKTALGAPGSSYTPGAQGIFVTAGLKRYFEVRLDVLGGAGSTSVGLANASNIYTDGSYLGLTNNSIGCFDDGQIIRNNITLTTVAVPVVTNIICIAFTSGSKMWERVGNGNWLNDIIANQNPATATGGVDISTLGDVTPAYNVIGLTGPSRITANFGPSFTFTPPAGFLPL